MVCQEYVKEQVRERKKAQRQVSSLFLVFWVVTYFA